MNHKLGARFVCVYTHRDTLHMYIYLYIHIHMYIIYICIHDVYVYVAEGPSIVVKYLDPKNHHTYGLEALYFLNSKLPRPSMFMDHKP